MFLILADFLSTLEGGEGGMDGEGSVHCRPGRYGKESRVGPQGGPVQQAVPEHAPRQAGTGRKEERVRRGVIQGGPEQQAVPEHAPRQAGTGGKQGGPVQEGSGQVGMGGGGVHIHHYQLNTSQKTTSEAAKAIFIQDFISIDILKHARLFK
jgi:hypothetical protein